MSECFFDSVIRHEGWYEEGESLATSLLFPHPAHPPLNSLVAVAFDDVGDHRGIAPSRLC